jgi:hypothetical protein
MRRIHFSWNLHLAQAGRDAETDQSTAKLPSVHTHFVRLLSSDLSFISGAQQERYKRLARHIEGVNYLKKPAQIIEAVTLS